MWGKNQKLRSLSDLTTFWKIILVLKISVCCLFLDTDQYYVLQMSTEY